MTRFFRDSAIAAVLLFAVSQQLSWCAPTSKPAPNKVGALCSNDKDCGENEECVVPKAIPACQKGTCQCKACYGLAHSETGTCSLVRLVRPCDPTCADSCNSTCHAGSKLEVYPANAVCGNEDDDAEDEGGDDSDEIVPMAYNSNLRCKSCYKAEGGLCVLIKASLAGPGGKCSSDCDCNSGLSCSATCGCAVGMRRLNDTYCAVNEFGDACSKDADCQHEESGLRNFGKCVSGKCACDGNSSLLEIGLTDDEEVNTVTKKVCLKKDSAAVVAAGESCSSDPFGDYDYFSNYDEDDDDDDDGTITFVNAGKKKPLTKPDGKKKQVCTAGTACFSCPLPDDETDEKCRKMNPPKNIAKKCEWAPASGNKTQQQQRVRGTAKVGQLCQTQTDCGVNERCLFSDVAPRCKYGKCACADCFAEGDDEDRNGNNLCAPVIPLKLGDKCAEATLETYPDNAECDSWDTEMVVCSDGFEPDATTKQTCVRKSSASSRAGSSSSDERGLAFGEACHLFSCSGNLECLADSAKVCTCDGSNEKWDATMQRCVEAKVGTICAKDRDCDDFGSWYPNGLVCKSGKCAASEFATSAEKDDDDDCFYCPEDEQETQCKVRIDKPRVNTAEECFQANKMQPTTCSVTKPPTATPSH